MSFPVDRSTFEQRITARSVSERVAAETAHIALCAADQDLHRADRAIGRLSLDAASVFIEQAEAHCRTARAALAELRKERV
jgi:hypothetical protein